MRLMPMTAIVFLFFQSVGGPLLAETLVLGSVNDNVRKHIDRMTPMAHYLEKHLAPAGVTDVQIKISTTSEDMAKALRAGTVDLYFDSPLVAARVARASGATPFLRRWKRGVASYHALIIVPAESEIQTLSDLAGRRIGFQEPDSTSGFLLPADMILGAALPLARLGDRSDSPADGQVGYVFTGDDKNTLLWLTRGWIDAGATDPRNWETLQEARPGAFRAIAQSIEVPRQVVIRRAGLDAGLLDEIATVLMAMGDRPEAAKVLKKFHKTTRFDKFPRGVDATFAPIHELLDRLDAAGTVGAS
ncbi:MAG: phosphate/phosphite/phosphonate ABC transporter substrate-binding protein [Silicimonas sp.]|nr:phosphate/phosphite/phosphonate ABC transporter substrate-binding protein [Silicimonas sp.]